MTCTESFKAISSHMCTHGIVWHDVFKFEVKKTLNDITVDFRTLQKLRVETTCACFGGHFDILCREKTSGLGFFKGGQDWSVSVHFETSVSISCSMYTSCWVSLLALMIDQCLSLVLSRIFLPTLYTTLVRRETKKVRHKCSEKSWACSAHRVQYTTWHKQ